jgi:cytochrome P450
LFSFPPAKNEALTFLFPFLVAGFIGLLFAPVLAIPYAFSSAHASGLRESVSERDVHEDLMHLTMEIATKTLFGAELADETAAEIGVVFDAVIVEIANRFRRPFKIPRWLPLPGNRRYKRAVARLDRLGFETIEKKRGAAGDDLLSMLLDARDEDGSAMDVQQVRDEAVTIFLAGHETTAIAISWTFHLLAQHPEIEAQLVAEIGDQRLDIADLPRRAVAP